MKGFNHFQVKFRLVFDGMIRLGFFLLFKYFEKKNPFLRRIELKISFFVGRDIISEIDLVLLEVCQRKYTFPQITHRLYMVKDILHRSAGLAIIMEYLDFPLFITTIFFKFFHIFNQCI